MLLLYTVQYSYKVRAPFFFKQGYVLYLYEYSRTSTAGAAGRGCSIRIRALLLEP